MKITLDSFLSVIKQSGLVEPDRLAKLLTDFRESQAAAADGGETATEAKVDAKSFAVHLVKEGHLTTWQAEKLLLGKHKGFSLGKYKLLSLLGKGGMSSVYLAEHKLMRRRVAIKVLPHKRVGDASYLGRFHREAQAVASLDHPNIVRAYDVDHEQDKAMEIHFLVMEHVDGRSLQEIIAEDGPLPVEQAAEYIRQSAEGLQHAHDNGLVHRDIKPGNLLVDTTGTVKMLDLGLARFFNDDAEGESLTIEHDEKVLGTADYLAPEQAVDSHLVDHRADIYSLGCTLYFLLTGQPPFTEGTLAQRLIAHQTKTPPPVSDKRDDVPESLDAILLRMMAKKPEDRPQTASDVAALLDDWLNDRGSGSGAAAAPAAPASLGSSDYEIETELSDFFNELDGIDGADGSTIGLKEMGSRKKSSDDSAAETTTGASSTTPGPTSRSADSGSHVQPGTPAGAGQGGSHVQDSSPRLKSDGPASGTGRSGTGESGASGTAGSAARSGSQRSAAARSGTGNQVRGRAAGRKSPSGVGRRGGKAGGKSAASDDFLDALDDLGELEAPPGNMAPRPGSGVTRGSQIRKAAPRGGEKKSTNKAVLALVAVLAAVGIAVAINFNSGGPGYDDSVVLDDGPSGPPPKEGRPSPSSGTATVGEAMTYNFGTLADAFAWAETARLANVTFELAAGEAFEGPLSVDQTNFDNTINTLTIRSDKPGGVRPNRPVITVPKQAGTDACPLTLIGTKNTVIEGVALDAGGRPNAVRLSGFLDKVRFEDCLVTNFSEIGVHCDGVTAKGDRKLLFKGVQFEGAYSEVDLVRLQSGKLPVSNVRFEECRFFGLPEKQSSNGISMWGDAENIEVARSVFRELVAGVRMGHGRSKLTNVRIVNNTFLDGYRGIVLGEPPADASKGLRIDRNLFVGMNAPALSVDNIGLIGGRVGPVRTQFAGLLDNYTTTLNKGGAEVGAVIDLFENGKRKIGSADFVTTNDRAAGFLKPQNNALGAVKSGTKYVGAVPP